MSQFSTVVAVTEAERRDRGVHFGTGL